MHVSSALLGLAALLQVSASSFSNDHGDLIGRAGSHHEGHKANSKRNNSSPPSNRNNNKHRGPHRGQRTKPILKQWPGFPPLPSLSDIHHLNTTSGSQKGSFLPLDNIQGDIFVGMKKPVETFFFYQITNPTAYKLALRNTVASLVTSTATLVGPASSQPLACLNMAYSQRGLLALGINDNLGDAFFTEGQLADATKLGDTLSDWESPWTSASSATVGIHGVLLIASDAQGPVDDLLQTVTDAFGSSITEVTRLDAAARPGSEAGHEHFGYLDGISNPTVQGFATTIQPGQVLLPPGIILTGRQGDTVRRPSWALDGSFMVFRKLQQLVPEWNKYVVANALQNPQGTMSLGEGAALFGARLVGRWQSGAPLDLAPLADDPALGADPTRNNDFNYIHPGASLSSDQSNCPFSAHIRKARPRADLGMSRTNSGGGDVNVGGEGLQDSDLVNQAIRAGIAYGPEVSSSESSNGATTTDRGLAFVEYQSNIGNGFRFQQTAWINVPNFPPGKNQTVGLDPVMGQVVGDGARTTLGLNPFNPRQSYQVPTFIKAKGGEYFFSPSIPALLSTIAR